MSRERRNDGCSTLAACAVAAVLAACSSSSSPGPGSTTSGQSGSDAGGTTPTCAAPGGPVSGAADAHCTGRAQPTSAASCHPDAGGIDAGDPGGPDYGSTLNGTEGDDDDCKYHLKWSSAPVCGNGSVSFTVVATNKSDGSPLLGANTAAEVFLSDTHPGPNTGVVLTETSPGTYVGGLQFDAPGKWTVRFHFHEECEDLLPDSPHGHAAFYVNVP